MSSKFQDGAAPITAAALPHTATLWSYVQSRFINVIQNCIKVSNPVLLTLYAMFLFLVDYCWLWNAMTLFLIITFSFVKRIHGVRLSLILSHFRLGTFALSYFRISWLSQSVRLSFDARLPCVHTSVGSYLLNSVILIYIQIHAIYLHFRQAFWRVQV